MAYLRVHSLAILSCSSLLEIYWVAMLPTKGSAKIKHMTISISSLYLKHSVTTSVVITDHAHCLKGLYHAMRMLAQIFSLLG